MADTRSLSNATSLRDGNVLRRVRQLGSARDGLAEWRLQRRTALALIPLGLYFVASMLRLATSDHISAALGKRGLTDERAQALRAVADQAYSCQLHLHQTKEGEPVQSGLAIKETL